MKKFLLIFLLFLLVATPVLVSADSFLPLVRCGNTGQLACTLADFFQMIVRIYKFMVYIIALPLAGLLILLGGVLILLSGINANWFTTGKNILWGTFIALALIFGSWLIINVVLKAIGYQLQWFTF